VNLSRQRSSECPRLRTCESHDDAEGRPQAEVRKDGRFARSEKARRVLFVDMSGRQGGAERSLQLLVRELAVRNIRGGIVCPAGAVSSAEFAKHRVFERFETCSFEPIRRPGVLRGVAIGFRLISAMFSVLKAIVMVRPHIVHANTTSAMLVAVLPIWLTRRLSIWHVRDMVPLGWIGKVCHFCASAVVVVSDAVKKNLVEQGIPCEKIHVVYNGVGSSFGDVPSRNRSRCELRAKFGFPTNSFIFVNVGQFAPWKRQDVFLEAAAQVAHECDRARFLVFGGEPAAGRPGCRKMLDVLARHLSLSDRVIIQGWQNNVGLTLAGCDALVHTAEMEPFGRVVIEAMQVGLPVIAVRAGGPAEIVRDGMSGLLAEPGNTSELASLMIRVLHDEHLARRLMEGGRKTVETLFSAERTARSIESVYDRVVAAKAEKRAYGRQSRVVPRCDWQLSHGRVISR
jgi:glycosyltransferase involved in cell wall biosynthesis